MPELNCHVCGADKTFVVNSSLHGMVTSDCQRYLPVRPRFRGCPGCGYIRVERDALLETDELFSERYQFVEGADDLEYVRFDGSGMPTGVADYLAELAVEFIQPRPDFRLLDIGAGKGTLVQSIHRKCPEISISAVEPSPAYEVLARREFLQAHYHGFFSAEQFAGQIFNLITLIDVLEHVPEPMVFLQNIRQLMNDEGYLLIEVPNFANNGFDLVTYDHISKFVPASLENTLTLAGFEVVKRWAPKTVAMQMVARKRVRSKSDSTRQEAQPELLPVNTPEILSEALGQCDFLLSQAQSLSLKPVAFYGQSIVAPYLVGSGTIKLEQVKAMIDDNVLYQGQQWLEQVPVIALDAFNKQGSSLPAILLTMNRCYHPRVAAKISKLEVYGLCL